ncbi:hypothetical protein F444_22388 [Phytophthora nicotianae P1976]|uniref:Uncharacterized protein n=1 Tax=Phytophthora nicotianae P1976 TaxID=1317066 RepID=A0A080YXY0_PHYNI|nr:hypothetical protein F444_22388 [Phytophthora nicotianae P1976]
MQRNGCDAINNKVLAYFSYDHEEEPQLPLGYTPVKFL